MKTTIISGVKVIFKGEKGKDTGYLKLQISRNNQIKVISLKIKCNKKDFNPTTQRLRSSADNYKAINDILDEKVNNYIYITPKSQITTFSRFIDELIKRASSYSTKEKYTFYNNLLKKFITQEYGKEDLAFEELDADFVMKLREFLKKGQKRVNSDNSVNLTLRAFKSFLKKATLQKVLIQPFNPFDIFQYPRKATEQSYLNINELKAVIDWEPREFRKEKNKIIDLKDIKEAFIFSCLGQGLRISDILTLRWNDFQQNNSETFNELSIFIKKKMFKTKEFVYVQLNTDIIRFLENQIDRFGILGVFTNSDVEEQYKRMKHFQQERIELKAMLVKELEHNLSEYELEELDEKYRKEFYDLDIIIANQIKFLILFLRKNETYRNNFVFPFLNNELFKKIDNRNNFGSLSKEQATNMKRTRINELLKKIIEQATGRNDIHFHSSRHTWTMLQLELDNIGMNLNDLKTALGHQNLSSTENYIKNFSNMKVRKMNDNITDNIFSNVKDRNANLT